MPPKGVGFSDPLSGTVNTPPPERRWLQITAQSRIGPPPADSGGHFALRASSLPIAFGVAVLGSDLVGDVAAAGLQVLVPAAFAQDPSPMPPKGVGFPDPLSGTLKTVETHRATVMRKLNLSSSANLVRYAIRNKQIGRAHV